MTSKELAEAMLDGSLNYSPTDDACSIAKSHLALIDFAEEVFKEYLSTGYLSTELRIHGRLLLLSDPAKR